MKHQICADEDTEDDKDEEYQEAPLLHNSASMRDALPDIEQEDEHISDESEGKMGGVGTACVLASVLVVWDSFSGLYCVPGSCCW